MNILGAELLRHNKAALRVLQAADRARMTHILQYLYCLHRNAKQRHYLTSPVEEAGHHRAAMNGESSRWEVERVGWGL